MKSPHNSIYVVIQSDKTFPDLNGHWAKADIEMLASKLIVKGVSESEFAPEARITRAQFVALLVRSLGLAANNAESSFRDTQTNDWFSGEVEAAVKARLVKGFADGTFRPNEQITREQMAAIMAATLKFAGNEPAIDVPELSDRFTDADKIHAWAKDAAAIAVGAEIMIGRANATFAPAAFATRAEAVSMLRRMLQHIDFIN
jgi:hypothetical protein